MIHKAHLTSIQEFKNIANLLINCQTSTFDTLSNKVISIFLLPKALLCLFLFAFLAFAKIATNFSLLKFQYWS